MIRVALAAGMVAAVAVGCCARYSQQSTANIPFSAATTFAYTTYIAPRSKYDAPPDGELGVVRDGTVAARIPGQFSDSVFFTDDGKHAVARKPGGGVDTEVLVYDVHTGRNRTPSLDIPSYADVRPGGESTVVWWERPDRLMRADLSQDDPKAQLLRTLALPAIDSGAFSHDTSVKADHDGRLLLARHEQPDRANGGPQSLYVIAPDGGIRGYGQEIGEAGITNASFSPDGKRLAYTGIRYAPPAEPGGVNSCFHDLVAVLDLDTGHTDTSDVQGHPDDATESSVHALWWGPDGTLHASSIGRHCGTGGERQGGQYAEWTKTGDGWIKLGDDPVLEARELAGGAKAVLLAEGQSDLVGTLYYVAATGQRIHLSDDVVTIGT